MRPSFHWADDGVVHIQLGEGWEALQDALEDSLGSWPPRGDGSDPPLTYWLDRVLALMHRSDGSRIELSSGNMSRITLAGTTVTASADYDTFDDIEVGAWEFEMLLRAWRREVLEARSRSEQAYADDHPSCSRTHATLRVFVRGLSADAVSHLLGIEPTRVTNPAASDSAADDETSRGWLLNSADHVDSNDLRRHIDFLLDAVDPAELAALGAERGATADVFCFWESKNGQGGPELEPGQMLRLGEIGLPLLIDCYMPDD